MTNEIQLISDGDGLAVIGDRAAVDRFLVFEELPSMGLGLERRPPERTALADAVSLEPHFVFDRGPEELAAWRPAALAHGRKPTTS